LNLPAKNLIYKELAENGSVELRYSKGVNIALYRNSNFSIGNCIVMFNNSDRGKKLISTLTKTLKIKPEKEGGLINKYSFFVNNSFEHMERIINIIISTFHDCKFILRKKGINYIDYIAIIDEGIICEKNSFK